MTASSGADTTDQAPATNAPSTRGGSFSGAYTNKPGNQRIRARTVSAPSHVGIRGRYDLPGNHYARFQWEIGSLTFGGTLPVTMYSPGLGLMSRNSGLFVGGPWGEFGFGIWDTPFSGVGNYAPAYGPLINASMLMSSGILGGMPFANGAVPGFPAQNFCIAELDSRTALSFTTPTSSDLTHCANNAMNFDRREANSLFYQSPTLAGLVLRSQLAVNFRRSSDFDAVNRSPWALSNSLAYTNGGFFAALGFEMRSDYLADAAQLARGIFLGGNLDTQAQWSSGPEGLIGSRERGLRLNVRYTAPFGLTAGILVEQLDYFGKYGQPAPGNILGLRKRAGRFELIFKRGDHTLGGAFHKALPLTAELSGPNRFNGADSAGFGVTVGYGYQVSKNFSTQVYAMTIVNETNARYNVVFQGLPSPAGADLRAFGLGLRYTF